MFRKPLRRAAILASLLAPPALPAADAPATQPATIPAADRPDVEVTFVLDTTGSMGGLIEGAKQKIWAIANHIIAQRDKPRVKIGLVAYRDRGDQYITRVFDLTDDIDTVFKNLMSFQADGGGDTPESVNQALNEAVTKISWSEKKETTKIIFLVGDAPPHMDYADDIKYPKSCEAAAKKEIIVNTVQCGKIPETAPIWQEIAKLGKGHYLSVPQDGGMVAIAAPQDKELAELNAKVAGTVLVYGNAAQQAGANDKVAANSSAALAPGGGGRASFFQLASRAEFNASDGGKAIQGRGDLVWDVGNGIVQLKEVKAADLPPDLAKLSPEKLKEVIDAKQKERDALNSRIATLSKERMAFVSAERKRQAETRPADQFDEKVGNLIHEQFEARHK